MHIYVKLWYWLSLWFLWYWPFPFFPHEINGLLSTHSMMINKSTANNHSCSASSCVTVNKSLFALLKYGKLHEFYDSKNCFVWCCCKVLPSEVVGINLVSLKIFHEVWKSVAFIYAVTTIGMFSGFLKIENCKDVFLFELGYDIELFY